MNEHHRQRSDDPLLQCYQEANARDTARPHPALRARVLARAHAQAALHAQAPATHQPTQAANDGTWKLRALGSLAVLGLVGLLALQFDRSTPEERELAFGSTAMRSPVTPPKAIATEQPAPTAHHAPVGGESTTAPAGPGATPPRSATSPAAAPALRQPAPAGPSAGAHTPAMVSAPESVRAPESPPAFTPAPASPAPAPASVTPANPVPAPGPMGSTAPAAAGARMALAPMTDAAQGLESATPFKSSASGAKPMAAQPPLVAAAAAGQRQVVQALLEQGDAPDQTDPQGRTALMLAAARGDTALVQRLLAAGADANRRDARGRTAADHARLAGHEALARHLTPSPGAGER